MLELPSLLSLIASQQLLHQQPQILVVGEYFRASSRQAPSCLHILVKLVCMLSHGSSPGGVDELSLWKPQVNNTKEAEHSIISLDRKCVHLPIL